MISLQTLFEDGNSHTDVEICDSPCLKILNYIFLFGLNELSLNPWSGEININDSSEDFRVVSLLWIVSCSYSELKVLFKSFDRLNCYHRRVQVNNPDHAHDLLFIRFSSWSYTQFFCVIGRFLPTHALFY